MLTRSRTSKNLYRAGRLCALTIIVCGMLGLSRPTYAQSDKWEVDVAPLYFWASELDGRISVRQGSVPIFMDFADAADNLAGAFAFYGEARKNRWGFLANINFVRLSTDNTFATPIFSRPVEGNAQLDMTIFEAGGSYVVRPDRNFAIIGGLRTYTLSPAFEFEGNVTQLTPVDASETAVSVFGGFTYRPRLSDKWWLVSGGDVGAGEAFTWSGTVGVEYRFKPWGGVMVGYRALGVDTGDVPEAATLPATTGDADAVVFDVTHYGPVFSLTFHWAQK